MASLRIKNFSRHMALVGVFLATNSISAKASTTNVFDILVATGSLTVVGTTTVQGSAFSVGGTTLSVSQGNIGIGISAPLYQLHIVGPLIGGYNAEFAWLSPYAALRVGGGPPAWLASTAGIFSVGLGFNNTATAQYSSVGGGSNNEASASTSRVGGGVGNLAMGEASYVGGGYLNTAYHDFTTVSGGFGNGAAGTGSAVGGGNGNIASSDYAVVGGGFSNGASGYYSTIPGGYDNTATGNFSFAAGRQADASSVGSFVWADSQGIPLISIIPNEFKARARGGFVLVSDASSSTIIVSSGSIMISTSPTALSAVPNIFISSVNGNVGIGKNNPLSVLDVNGAISASSASFAATGSNIYSVTSSSGIHILAGGITWPDGTTSASSATSGGASFTNEWQWVADTVAVNDVGVGFSNLVSSVVYRIEIDVNANTATSRLMLTFNGDNGANYSYSYLSESDTNTQLNAGGTGQTSITLCADSSSVGGEYHGDVDFATAYSLPKKVMVKSTWTYLSTSAILNGHSGGRYVGSSNLSSARVSIGSGKINGVVKLFKRNGTAW